MTLPEFDPSRPVIVLLGDVMVDIVATLDGEIRRGTDTASRNFVTGGGAAANTAAWLGSLGSQSVLIGCIGADAFGDVAIAELDSFGVTTQLLRTTAAATGSVVAIVHADGERTMFPDAGANLALTAAHVEATLTNIAARTDGGHLHVSGYTLMREPTRGTAEIALGLGKELGFTTSIDPASVGPMRDVGLDVVRDWLRLVDLLIANEDEAEALTDAAPMEAQGEILTALAPAVIVKGGATGARWYGRDGRHAAVPSAPAPVADTLGAGDAFAAGALPAWKSGRDPYDVLVAGTDIAARCVARSGARPARR